MLSTLEEDTSMVLTSSQYDATNLSIASIPSTDTTVRHGDEERAMHDPPYSSFAESSQDDDVLPDIPETLVRPPSFFRYLLLLLFRSKTKIVL